MEKKVRIRDLEKEKRIPYIWEYYKWWILGVVLAVAAVIFILVQIFMPRKDVVLRVCAVNVDGSVIRDSSYFDDFMKQNQYDLNEKQLDVNFNLTIDMKNTTGTAQTTLQNIFTLMNAGAVDVFLSDEELFQSLADEEMIENLEDYASEEFLEEHKKDIVYGTSLETGEKYPAGVRLSKDSRFLQDDLFYVTPAVIGFCGPLEQDYEAQKQFLEYAFQQK
ncbi:MAG: hypothetical protein ACI4HI_05310 [Lachnospiraceae bacterium]